MQRRRRESYGRRGLARSGRVVGSREGFSSSTATGLEAVACANLGGSGHCKWPGVVSGRATRGGKWRNTAASGHRIRAVRLEWSLGPVRARWARFPGVRALGGSSARRLGGAAAHRLTGPEVGEAPEPESRRSARPDHQAELGV